MSRTTIKIPLKAKVPAPSGAAAAAPPPPITITVDIHVVNGQLDDSVANAGGTSPRQRKFNMIADIRNEKHNRTKTYVVPGGDHSEHFEHDSWMPRPGDTVVFVCD